MGCNPKERNLPAIKAAAFSSSGVPVPRPFRFLDARNFTSSRKSPGSIVAVAPKAAIANEHRTSFRAARMNFRAARVSKRSANFFDIPLVQFRGGQGYFATAIFSGIVSRLLIVDFVVDDCPQVGPIH